MQVVVILLQPVTEVAIRLRLILKVEHLEEHPEEHLEEALAVQALAEQVVQVVEHLLEEQVVIPEMPMHLLRSESPMVFQLQMLMRRLLHKHKFRRRHSLPHKHRR